MSYYSGGRRFALGGKGWTIVLGTTVSLAYIRAKAKLFDENNSQAYHELKNRQGEQLSFHDQPKEIAGEKEDIVLQLWRRLPQAPLPNMYMVGGVLTCLWAYRMGGTFNRLMTVRFADVNYQLRRPDVLANKVVTLKYLGLPLVIVPALAAGCYAASVALTPEGEDPSHMGPLRRQAQALRATLADNYREASYLARDVVAPMQEELATSPLANFAQRSQTVGREVRPHQLMGDTVMPPGGHS